MMNEAGGLRTENGVNNIEFLPLNDLCGDNIVSLRPGCALKN